MFRNHVIDDGCRFLPRSFRPYYEGRGPSRGEEELVRAPFEQRLSVAKIALLTSWQPAEPSPIVRKLIEARRGSNA